MSGDRAFYVTGRSDQSLEQKLQADIKFTEFIADIVGSLQRQRQLERQQSGLRQFFSPPISKHWDRILILHSGTSRVRCHGVVLRFARLQSSGGRVGRQPDRTAGASESGTGSDDESDLRFGGVTGDFQGDAALGFWGWPIASSEAPLNACRAALAIREEFARAQLDPGHPLKDFETSIGIAYGRAVAGKIGTREQVKVTVFGPVVNLASRLESMTRELHVPILIDEYLDAEIRQRMSREEGRVRRLVRVLPYGMDRSLMVSELVPPEDRYPVLKDPPSGRI